MAVWVMAYNTIFNNISAISWRFGLWRITPLSTIFQLYHGGLVYYAWHHFQQYFSYIMSVWFIMLDTTFNNISTISWRFGLWRITPFSTIFQLYHGDWFIMLNTTFTNISTLSCRFGLICLTPLSTIFQLYHVGLVYYAWHHFQQYFSSIMAVWVMVFNTIFNNISTISWRLVYYA